MATLYYANECQHCNKFMSALSQYPDIASQIRGLEVRQQREIPEVIETVPALILNTEQGPQALQGTQVFAWLEQVVQSQRQQGQQQQQPGQPGQQQQQRYQQPQQQQQQPPKQDGKGDLNNDPQMEGIQCHDFSSSGGLCSSFISEDGKGESAAPEGAWSSIGEKTGSEGMDSSAPKGNRAPVANRMPQNGQGGTPRLDNPQMQQRPDMGMGLPSEDVSKQPKSEMDVDALIAARAADLQSLG